jgi:hypothetical protein
MIDEVQLPAEPRLYICPCCFFSFNELPKFIRHLELMKKLIDAAQAKAEKK